MTRNAHPLKRLLLASLASGTLVTFSAFAHESPRLPVYSLTEQTDAVTAFKATLTGLDQLDTRLLSAYGPGGSALRVEAVRLSPLSKPVEVKPIESPSSLTRKKGQEVLERVASLEPLLSVCAVNSQTLALRLLQRETSLLLRTRELAKKERIADWIREGGADGSERLQGASELDCQPVRAAFKASATSLENAYLLVRAARIEQPVSHYSP